MEASPLLHAPNMIVVSGEQVAKKTKHDYYDNQFKETAVEFGSLPSVLAKDVAGILHIHPVILYRCKIRVLGVSGGYGHEDEYPGLSGL